MLLNYRRCHELRDFNGYRREDGSIGVRNHVIIMNTSGELSSLTKKIASMVPGVIPVVHQGGNAQFTEDFNQTLQTLKGTAMHPNVSATLLLDMGNEEVSREIIKDSHKKGRVVHALSVNSDKTMGEVIEGAKRWLESAVLESKKEPKVLASVTELIVGLECGGSDSWSGITANPSIGSFSDMMVNRGGTSVLAETTEAIGAEHILAKQSINKHVANQFLSIVARYEKRAKYSGEDVRSANPSPGNIAGGLTTLEEKSLGCIKKGGSTPLMEVVEYAHQPSKKGFVFMDTPGYDVESVTGLAAGGAQIVLFSTGKGSPTGSPMVPVIKIGTNQKVYENMSEHIDINAGTIITENDTINDIGCEIYQKVMSTANGEKVSAESQNHQEFAIWRLAETI